MEPLDPEVGGVNGHGPPEIDQKIFDTITGAKIENSTHALSIIECVIRLCNIGDPDDPIQNYTSLYKPETLVELRKIREDFPAEYHGVFEPWARAHRDMFWPDLDRMITNALLPSEIPITLPHRPEAIMPPLPASAMLDPALAVGAAPWLDEYIAFSRTWATRAAEGFHEAVGLWILSAMAARRVCTYMGDPVYPSLFLALIAPSSIYTKTSTGNLGFDALKSSGGGAFIGADRTTPQAFLRDMTGRVPSEFPLMDINTQADVLLSLAFAGQRAWFFDEWGGMLKQMIRGESPLAAFHDLLRVLDDARDTFSSSTIQRGMERVDAPYLALLTSATFHDLEPFMRPGHRFWHDGFWARFAFIPPGPHEVPSMTHRPTGKADMPQPLKSTLVQWHLRLGIPRAEVEPVVDQKGKATGQLRRKPVHLPCIVLTLDADVLAAYHAYGDALYLMVIHEQVHTDLSASYMRFQHKALRIALLFASLEDAPTIAIRHWVRAQQITERWRMLLHHAIDLVVGTSPVSKELQLEDRIVRILGRDGPNSARYCQRHIKGSTSNEITKTLKDMVSVGRVVTMARGKAMVYALATDSDQPDADDMADATMAEETQNDVPF